MQLLGQVSQRLRLQLPPKSLQPNKMYQMRHLVLLETVWMQLQPYAHSWRSCHQLVPRVGHLCKQ